MSAKRMRVAILKECHGAGKDFPFAIQLTGDGLTWSTVGRFKKDLDALQGARELSGFIKTNALVAPAAVLLELKLDQ